MKRLLFASLILTGCTRETPSTPTTTTPALRSVGSDDYYRVVPVPDSVRGVTCYVYMAAISCVNAG
jgi:hypothetical protein